MAYERNTAGQQIVFAAINKTTGDVVSGDALNITGVFSTDGNAAALMGNSATEIDAGGIPASTKWNCEQWRQMEASVFIACLARRLMW